MEALRDRTREYLERRTSISVLSTLDATGLPESCVLIAPRLTEQGHIAGGEEADVAGGAFRNLRRNPRACLLVLDPVMDPRARDGVRVEMEFLGAEDAGEGLAQINAWLASFAPGRKVVRRLIFKILRSSPYRPPTDTPVLLDN